MVKSMIVISVILDPHRLINISTEIFGFSQMFVEFGQSLFKSSQNLLKLKKNYPKSAENHKILVQPNFWLKLKMQILGQIRLLISTSPS